MRYLKTHRILKRPHLLIVYSHKSHVYNVAFFDLMQEMNIHVMAIPPHTCYTVQVLDSMTFAQLKTKTVAKLFEAMEF